MKDNRIYLIRIKYADVNLYIVLHMSSSTKYIKTPGPQFIIKMPSYQYRKSHFGDQTILRPSYLHNGISYTG